MKRLFCIVLILFISNNVCSQTEESLPSSFFGIPFGSTIKEVKKEMKKKGGNNISWKKKFGNSLRLQFKCSSLIFAGEKCTTVSCSFFDGKFYSGSVEIYPHIYANEEKVAKIYKEKYLKMENGLISKYGNPIKGEDINKQNGLRSEWSDDKTKILMMGHSEFSDALKDGYNVNLGWIYISIQYLDRQLFEQLKSHENSDF